MLATICKAYKRVNFNILLRNYSRLSYALQKHQLNINKSNLDKCPPIFFKYPLLSSLPLSSPLETQRHYSKKKKSSKKQVEEDEESEEEDEDFEDLEPDLTGDNMIIKSLASLRLDNVVKVGLRTAKKKVEKDFYANKMRINGQKILKKATNVYVDDEVDLVKGYSPENNKFLIVDRIVVKSIGKPNLQGNFPVKMQIFKELTIENYPDPWSKTDVLEEA